MELMGRGKQPEMNEKEKPTLLTKMYAAASSALKKETRIQSIDLDDLVGSKTNFAKSNIVDNF